MAGLSGASVTYDGDAVVVTDTTGLASNIPIPSGTPSGTLTIFKSGYQTITVNNFTPVAGQTYTYTLIPVGASTFQAHLVDSTTGNNITSGTVSFAGGTPVAVDANGMATLVISSGVTSGLLEAIATGYVTVDEQITPVAGTTIGVNMTPVAITPAPTSAIFIVAGISIVALIALFILGVL